MTTNGIIIYPNPVLSMATIEGAAGASVRIHDMNGKALLEKTISNDIETIDLSSLSAGIYYAEILSETKKQIIKLVKN